MVSKNILVIGGAGYVGTVLTQHLLEHGYGVRCLDNLMYDQHAAVMPFIGARNYEFVLGNLGDRRVVDRCINDMDAVVILAGIVGESACRQQNGLARQVNEVGMGRLFSACQGRVERVVFASTCSNYGISEGLAHEDSELRPLGHYAIAKVNREVQLLKSGLDIACSVVLRFATAFGLSPRMRFDLTLSEFLYTMAHETRLAVYDAETWRPYVHVRDMARAIETVLRVTPSMVAGQVFNVGCDENHMTKRMLCEAIAGALPFKPEVAYGEGRSSDARDYRVSFEKIKNKLGFLCEYTIDNGIRELLAALGGGFFGDYRPFNRFYRNDVQTVKGALARPMDMEEADGLD